MEIGSENISPKPQKKKIKIIPVIALIRKFDGNALLFFFNELAKVKMTSFQKICYKVPKKN